MESVKRTCEEQIWVVSGYWSHYRPCTNKAKVERNGKHYCGIHDPEAQKAKEAKKVDECIAKWAEEGRKRRVELAAPQMLDALETVIEYYDAHSSIGEAGATVVRAAIKAAKGEA